MHFFLVFIYSGKFIKKSTQTGRQEYRENKHYAVKIK